MPTEYTIQKHPHGHLIIGSVPIDDFRTLAGLGSKDAVIHSGVASYYGATLAFGDAAEMDLWAAEIEDSIKTQEPPELRFMNGTHVGRSSKTIVAALSNNQQAVSKAVFDRGHDFQPNIPYDADDFSRCHYLLTLCPEWIPRMKEVGDKYPETKWPQLAAVWPELMELYEAKKHKELTDRIKEVIK